MELMLLHVIRHLLQKLRVVLPIAVHLDRVIVPVTLGVEIAGLYCRSNAAVDGQIDQVIAMFFTELLRLVQRTVVDDHVVKGWRVLSDILHRIYNAAGLIKGRDNHKSVLQLFFLRLS